MARPITFDPDAARDQALLLFWQKGYQATSLPDLLGAMGIGRSSFYAAYGDKQRLFVTCLDLFAERTQAVLLRARQTMHPLDALQLFFERHLNGPGRQRASLGCLLVNTVLEMSGVDEGLAERAGRHLGDMERLFEAALCDAGCVPAKARDHAALLMLLNEGVRVSSRRRLGARAQHGSIEAMFRMLRLELAASGGGAVDGTAPDTGNQQRGHAK